MARKIIKINKLKLEIEKPKIVDKYKFYKEEL